MLLSQEKFVRLSFKLHPEISLTVWNDLHLFLVERTLYLSNKEIVSIIRSFLKTKGYLLTQQKTYEFLARLSGEKNWNIASAKKLEFYKLFNTAVNNRIRTGILNFDIDTLGGLPRGGITTIIGSPNSGKSLMAISLACNALRQGFKVLQITLEGLEKETPSRYLANLSNVDYVKIINNKLTEQDFIKVESATKKTETFLRQELMSTFNVTIEGLQEKCHQIWQEFKFDILVIDYAQLLNSSIIFNSHREKMNHIYLELDKLSKTFNCALISPTQTMKITTKKNEEQMFKLIDSSESISLGEISHLAFSINRTEEMSHKFINVYLEKNRGGFKKDIVYKLQTDFPKCNLTSGIDLTAVH